MTMAVPTDSRSRSLALRAASAAPVRRAAATVGRAPSNPARTAPSAPRIPRRQTAPVRFASPTGETASSEIDALVQEIIGRVADKWTLLVLEVLAQQGTLRFTRIGVLVGTVSQKMLTKTLRDMERDGFVIRTVHPVIPPHVDYTLTPLGHSLGAAFCSVWHWAEQHHAELQAARIVYNQRQGA